MKAFSTATQTGAGTGATIGVDSGVTGVGKFSLNVVVTGTVNYDVEWTNNKPTAGTSSAPDFSAAQYVQHAVLNGKTANYASDLLAPATGFRVKVNSGTGSATLYILQETN